MHPYTRLELPLSFKRFCNIAPDKVVSCHYKAINKKTLLKYHLAGKMMSLLEFQQSGICRHRRTAQGSENRTSSQAHTFLPA